MVRAVEYVNDSEAYDFRIEYTEYDTEMDPATGVDVAREAVDAGTDYLARDTGDDADFDAIADALDRMDEMIDDPLTLARAETTVEHT